MKGPPTTFWDFTWAGLRRGAIAGASVGSVIGLLVGALAASEAGSHAGEQEKIAGFLAGLSIGLGTGIVCGAVIGLLIGAVLGAARDHVRRVWLFAGGVTFALVFVAGGIVSYAFAQPDTMRHDMLYGVAWSFLVAAAFATVAGAAAIGIEGNARAGRVAAT